jgi:N-acetylneuraminate synthase/N,N'-diacetyllegionaminate synthase
VKSSLKQALEPRFRTDSQIAKSITVAGREIGSGAPCFVIAEAGVNHNGDVALAHQLIDAAADAGADAIKFQTFDAVSLALPRALKADYQMRSSEPGESQLEMLRRLELPQDAYSGLINHTKEKNLIFLSSPFDEASADYLERLGLPAFKIPSGEVTNLPFLSHVARKGRPLLVSTGMCHLAEVAEAVEEIQQYGSPPLALLHCVSCYPAASEECNLRALQTLRSQFGVPVGWSDHTLGTSVAAAAVALGASLLEKHLTLDKNMAGPDHQVSLQPGEFKSLVISVREIEQALGNGIKQPSSRERDTAIAVRKSLCAAHDLSPGEILREDDLVARRPGDGISPARRNGLVGRKLTRPRKTGECIQEGDLA